MNDATTQETTPTETEPVATPPAASQPAPRSDFVMVPMSDGSMKELDPDSALAVMTARQQAKSATARLEALQVAQGEGAGDVDVPPLKEKPAERPLPRVSPFKNSKRFAASMCEWFGSVFWVGPMSDALKTWCEDRFKALQAEFKLQEKPADESAADAMDEATATRYYEALEEVYNAVLAGPEDLDAKGQPIPATLKDWQIKDDDGKAVPFDLKNVPELGFFAKAHICKEVQDATRLEVGKRAASFR